MDSIIQKDKEHCFLCGGNNVFEPLDKHHVFGASNRSKSEEYGLTIYLHHSKCHICGCASVHQNAAVNKAVKKIVQKKAMVHYGWTENEFISIFGKSYL